MIPNVTSRVKTRRCKCTFCLIPIICSFWYQGRGNSADCKRGLLACRAVELRQGRIEMGVCCATPVFTLGSGGCNGSLGQGAAKGAHRPGTARDFLHYPRTTGTSQQHKRCRARGFSLRPNHLPAAQPVYVRDSAQTAGRPG